MTRSLCLNQIALLEWCLLYKAGKTQCSFLRELEAAKFKAKVLTEPVSARILLTPLVDRCLFMEDLWHLWERGGRGDAAFLYTFKGTNPIWGASFLLLVYFPGASIPKPSYWWLEFQTKTTGYKDLFNRTRRTWSFKWWAAWAGTVTRADCREEEGSIVSYGTQGHPSEAGWGHGWEDENESMKMKVGAQWWWRKRKCDSYFYKQE